MRFIIEIPDNASDPVSPRDMASAIEARLTHVELDNGDTIYFGLGVNVTPCEIADPDICNAARVQYANGSDDDIEIDDEPAISGTGPDGDDGVWVAAWVFVRSNEPPDDEGMEAQFNWRNFYRHDDCEVQPGIEWEGQWSCQCNEECPACRAEIEPYESEEVES